MRSLTGAADRRFDEDDVGEVVEVSVSLFGTGGGGGTKCRKDWERSLMSREITCVVVWLSSLVLSRCFTAVLLELREQRFGLREHGCVSESVVVQLGQNNRNDILSRLRSSHCWSSAVWYMK